MAVAFDQTARTASKRIEVKRSGYRPLYVTPQLAARSAFAPEVLLTAADAWNEDRPLPEREYVPKYEPTKPDDAKKGTREEERKQAFVVGVAAEVPVPTEWVNPKAEVFQRLAAAVVAAGPLGPGLPLGVTAGLISPDDLAGSNRKTVRVAVFGHGGLFNGPKLDAGQEALLLGTVNWQLRREERMPATDLPESARWQYPRVPLSAQQRAFWSLGAWLGLPAVVAYVGLLAFMLRRLR